ncbi:hypothetical protein [Roseinatronobacter alkalisoli]|uniref:Uncharacterized protein n=1 Tax=Roseinatronobacter alkalisoli TaxID=3028235 RepID=A0ABT5TCN5_9RHOB|nr:hypothetical protein [Roseinatronobacter sp. HJB301]MDD7972724.1 hypothetical protein [Roseinatronobacter sp. HJB301]
MKQKPQSLAQLSAHLDARTGCGDEAAIAHVMWLLKMGYCRPVQSVSA